MEENNKPLLLITRTQKVLINAERDRALWCHKTPKVRMHREMSPGRAMCGIDTDPPHCEVDIPLEDYEHYMWNYGGGHLFFDKHDRKSGLGYTMISPCLRCPYCGVHTYVHHGPPTRMLEVAHSWKDWYSAEEWAKEYWLPDGTVNPTYLPKEGACHVT